MEGILNITLVILVFIVGALNIFCFFLGAVIGQRTATGKEIKAPDLNKLNPMTIYKEHSEKKEAEKEKEKLETILKNIERYDGTEAGQEDIK